MLPISPTGSWCLGSLAFAANKKKDSRKSRREDIIMVPVDHPFTVSLHILSQ